MSNARRRKRAKYTTRWAVLENENLYFDEVAHFDPGAKPRQVMDVVYSLREPFCDFKQDDIADMIPDGEWWLLAKDQDGLPEILFIPARSIIAFRFSL